MKKTVRYLIILAVVMVLVTKSWGAFMHTGDVGTMQGDTSGAIEELPAGGERLREDSTNKLREDSTNKLRE